MTSHEMLVVQELKKRCGIGDEVSDQEFYSDCKGSFAMAQVELYISVKELWFAVLDGLFVPVLDWLIKVKHWVLTRRPR